MKSCRYRSVLDVTPNPPSALGGLRTAARGALLWTRWRSRCFHFHFVTLREGSRGHRLSRVWVGYGQVTRCGESEAFRCGWRWCGRCRLKTFHVSARGSAPRRVPKPTCHRTQRNQRCPRPLTRPPRAFGSYRKGWKPQTWSLGPPSGLQKGAKPPSSPGRGTWPPSLALFSFPLGGPPSWVPQARLGGDRPALPPPRPPFNGCHRAWLGGCPSRL